MSDDETIIEQTNQLARKLCASRKGYPEGYKFYNADHGTKADKAWLRACTAQEFLCGVNVEEVLERLEGRETRYGMVPQELNYRSLEDMIYCIPDLRFYWTGRFVNGDEFVKNSLKKHKVEAEDLGKVNHG